MTDSRRVHYFCFAVDDATESLLSYFPSAQPKIAYVVNTLKDLGLSVIVVSSCSISKPGYFAGMNREIDDNERHVFFPSFRFSNRLGRRLSALYSFLQLVRYWVRNVGPNDIVMIYHSLFYVRPIQLANFLQARHFVLEVEELYSFVLPEYWKHRKSEMAFIDTASSFLLVNDLIQERVHLKDRQAVISYGSYALPTLVDRRPFPYSDYINVVYAGVIEQSRNAASLAVSAALHLPKGYRTHILGFGNVDDIKRLLEEIAAVNHRLGEERVLFHGKLSGSAYFGFLQACDIGLSTHTYSAELQESADYSFPSKILVYLANGLKVVSADLRVIRESALSPLVVRYSPNTARALADAIAVVDILDDEPNPRKFIEELDLRFRRDLSELLGFDEQHPNSLVRGR